MAHVPTVRLGMRRHRSAVRGKTHSNTENHYLAWQRRPHRLPRNRQVYAVMEQEAKRRGSRCTMARHPGQEGEASGKLSYLSAFENALRMRRDIEPNWLIGRSFGCLVGVQPTDSPRKRRRSEIAWL